MMHLLHLPVIVVEQILSYLNYDEIAKYRIVCRDLDRICQRMLNRGFLLIERKHAQNLKAIKALLPKRESERRFHTLSRHCDILTSIETRLSMLSMTYTKFIDHNACCFIPGKVIDEIRRVLALLDSPGPLPRAHEVLQELRDISSMAIEHFDDKISPALRQKMQENNPPHPKPFIHHTHPELGPVRVITNTPSYELMHLKTRCQQSQNAILSLRRKNAKVTKKLKFYRKYLVAQHRHMKEMSRRQSDQEMCMAELRKRIEECDVKYHELTHTQSSGGKSVLDISNSDLRSSSTPIQKLSHSLKNFGSQIKLDPSISYIGSKKLACPNIKPRKSLSPPSLDSLDSQNQFLMSKKPTDYYSLSKQNRTDNSYHKAFSIKESVSNILKKCSIVNTSFQLPASSSDCKDHTSSISRNSNYNVLRRFSYDCERGFQKFTPRSYNDTTDSSKESNYEEWSKFTIMNVTGIFKNRPLSKSRNLSMVSHSNINLTGESQEYTDKFLEHCFNSFVQQSGSGKKKPLENDNATSSRKRSYSTSILGSPEQADINLPSTSGLHKINDSKRGKL